MVASTSVPLTKKSQASFIEHYRSVQSITNLTRSDHRARLERADRNYQREVDRTEEHIRAQRANNIGDPNRFQNITVPIVMPQVESAVTHQSSVYLSDYPLFGMVAAPEFIDEALQMETVLDENAVRGGWNRELLLFFRHGFKYNFAPMEVTWAEEVSYSVETDIKKSLTQGIPKHTIWSGNRLTHWDPYNTFVDARVSPSNVYKDGEFAGHTEFMSRIKLKSFIATLPDKIISNIRPAFESGLGSLTGAKDSSARNFYIPSINPLVSEENYKNSGTNWMRWAGLSSTLRDNPINYKDGYEVTTVYVKILPSEFSLAIPNNETPQIYKLIIVNHEHIIYAELQTNAHNWIPVMIGQPLEDGLEYQTKSLAENGAPFQEVTSAYMSSIIASRRRAISDRVLYDPSRVTKANINSENPSAKIPVRPAAYGQKLADAVYAFPYREDQAGSSMQQIQALIGLSNTLVGQNPVTQGQFIKGNKTDDQFAETLQSSKGRDQLASLLLEDQCFTPLKHILKLNMLQFQGGTTVYNRDKDRVVEVDPLALRKAVLNFKVSDGLTSKERLLKPDTFNTALQVFASSPEVASQYNLGPLFSYFMKTQGGKISSFEKSAEQVAYEQALGAWQSLATAAIDKGLDPEDPKLNLPPQPLPEQFGYDPAANKPKPQGITTDSPGAPSSAPTPGVQ